MNKKVPVAVFFKDRVSINFYVAIANTRIRRKIQEDQYYVLFFAKEMIIQIVTLGPGLPGIPGGPRNRVCKEEHTIQLQNLMMRMHLKS